MGVRVRSRMDGTTFVNDKFRSTLDRAKQELSRRAHEADFQAMMTRMAERHDIKTLHHGLQWMWKSEQMEALSLKKAEAVKKLAALVKELKRKSIFQEETIKELSAEIQKLKGADPSARMESAFLSSILGLLMKTGIKTSQ